MGMGHMHAKQLNCGLINISYLVELFSASIGRLRCDLDFKC